MLLIITPLFKSITTLVGMINTTCLYDGKVSSDFQKSLIWFTDVKFLQKSAPRTQVAEFTVSDNERKGLGSCWGGNVSYRGFMIGADVSS